MYAVFKLYNSRKRNSSILYESYYIFVQNSEIKCFLTLIIEIITNIIKHNNG